MPQYIWTAKSRPQKIISGDIEAESEQDAIIKLTHLGYFPISVQDKNAIMEKQGIINLYKVRNREIASFTLQLSNLIESGINILSSLNIIISQTSNKYLKSVLKDVAARIKDGSSFSESLAAYPGIFPRFYCSLIHTGEAGGSLNAQIKDLAGFLEEQEDFKSILRSSLIYPIFIMAVGVLTVAVLLIFVIPRLIIMFEDMGEILPLPTRILITSSDFLRNYCWIIFLAIAVLVFLFKRILGTAQGRTAWDNFKLKISILGQMILKMEISRFSRTLGILLSSGIPISLALDISVTVINNEVIKSETARFNSLIAGGLSLSQAFKGSKFFPNTLVDIVRIGEETGALDKSLLRIAESYEKDTSRSLKTLGRMLEPVIILIMGLVVGFIVLSMLLPIFQINLIAK